MFLNGRYARQFAAHRLAPVRRRANNHPGWRKILGFMDAAEPIEPKRLHRQEDIGSTFTPRS